MASATFKTKLQQDLLTCPICCSQYVNPRVLKCQHSFCHGCLQGCLDASKPSSRNSVKCAVCRKLTPVPKKGLIDIPNNFVIAGLLQMVKDHNKDFSSGVGDQCSSTEKTNFKTKTKNEKGKSPPKSKGKVAALKAKFEKKDVKDKNDNKPLLKRHDSSDHSDYTDDETSGLLQTDSSAEEFTPTDGSSSYSSYGDDDSSCSDHEDTYSTDDDDYSTDNHEDDFGCDTPPKPTMKSSHGIKIGMEVCIFSAKGKPYDGIVRVLEKFVRKGPGLTNVYAGLELERENSRLTTDDINDMDDSYLFHWLMDYDLPCTVVRVDQCCPAKLVKDLLK